MLKKQIQDILMKVQMTNSHQKFLVMLTNIYKTTPTDEFFEVFLLLVKHVFRQGTDQNIYTNRILKFISRFCADITKQEDNDNETHDFLNSIIETTLKCNTSNLYEMRYNSSCLLSMILEDIGDEVQLEVNLIDEIQKVLLERAQEPKIPIRVAALSALTRLQDPQNFECPVVKAYIQAFLSVNPQVRKEATHRVAPNIITLSKIRDRVRDVDPGVRFVAFRKCADIGAVNFRIADKHVILLCGFKETNAKANDAFLNYLLPKWLTDYKDNYLKFVEALKLTSEEEDIVKMTYLSKEVIKEFYNKQPIRGLISVLPINEDKLIDVENLSNEVTLFWNVLISLMRDSGNMDDHLSEILPDLTPFCHYIERVVKLNSSEKMDEWKFFDYQFDLLNLLEIAENYDFSDEVGRRTMHSVIMNILQNNNFNLKVTKKFIAIAQKCSSNIDIFTHDMCQLISEIREPLITKPSSENQLMDHNFKVSQLRVQINILEESKNQAVEKRSYQEAAELEQKLNECNKQLQTLQTSQNVETVRVMKSDDATLCRCLDILGSVLELPAVSKMTPSLITCKDHFLGPQITVQSIEVHWRVLKCLALFSVICKSAAEEYAKLICVPIATYRSTPNNNVMVLTNSICAVADLISLYGIEIFGFQEEVVNTTSGENGRRKLYSNDNDETVTNPKLDNLTSSYILEVFLDMLDDEREEIRLKAIIAITALVRHSFPVTPSFLSRILLKWYNPLTEKQDSRLQVSLGFLIQQFLQLKDSGQVIKEAIIPTISSIVCAPRTSPLVDIDMPNVLLFFGEMMNIKLQKDDLRILAFDICMKISEDIGDRIVPYLSKLLCCLDLEQTNTASLEELIERAGMLLPELTDKVAKRNIEKFIGKLKQHSIVQTTVNTTVNTEISNQTNESSGNEKQRDVTLPEPKQVKRKKNRTSRKCMVLLERMSLSDKSNMSHNTTVLSNNTSHNTTVLHTIREETNMEFEKYVSSRNLSTEISETSDSDNGKTAKKRRSMRPRRKRVQ